MTLLLNHSFQLVFADHQTNVKFPFEIEESAEKLVIEFSYDPPHIEDEQAMARVDAALKKFIPPEELEKRKTWGTAKRFMPLQNLVTLSLSHDGEYLGARHRKQTEQKIEISENQSSKGFLKHSIQPGKWEAQLNVHCVASETIEGSLKIYTEGEK